MMDDEGLSSLGLEEESLGQSEGDLGEMARDMPRRMMGRAQDTVVDEVLRRVMPQ